MSAGLILVIFVMFDAMLRRMTNNVPCDLFKENEQVAGLCYNMRPYLLRVVTTTRTLTLT